MSSLFVMLASFWMVFWGYKTELVLFFSVTEGTGVDVNLVSGDVWGSKMN